MRWPAFLLRAIELGFLSALSYAQAPGSFLDGPSVPPNFNFDIETGTRLRSQLFAESMPVAGRYATGGIVFKHLIAQVLVSSGTKFAWELRVVNDDQLNAYSSPEGTIYVGTDLAQLAGQSTGLWAAILSHEIAHVVRRDWGRRYLYQKSLERDSVPAIVLGDPALPSASWTDSQTASKNLGRFCRQLELGADRDSLMLMARAGYHPHFVPALHHLLHATGSGAAPTSLYAMHPCWEERDQELMEAYVNASIEFERRWPEGYASPGGNPPIVVFAATPTVKKTRSKEWEIQVPIRCENLAGAVEVVLRIVPTAGDVGRPEHFLDQPRSEFELRQVTGCTSPLTTVSFTLPAASDRSKSSAHWADVNVFDAWGAILARVSVPKLPH
ncbi:MAG TPA: M48 family metalloprotease [Terriglobales bacterium]|nr:M48 family metalloprotease [Terriglobales bacterium]